MSPGARLVVISGTSGGLGRALARRLTATGYRVVGVSRRAVDPAGIGEGYAHVCADLGRLEDVPRVAKEIVNRFGTPYALVNNAAVGADGLLLTMPDEALAAAVSLNLVSPLLMTKYLSRPMVSRGEGRIVNVSSIVASTGFRGLSVYAAAKAGLEGLTRSLARDLGRRGVTVNAIAPGFLETEMTSVLEDGVLDRVRSRSPLGRFASVEEVSAGIEYLLAPDSGGVTGTVLTVDAGATS